MRPVLPLLLCLIAPAAAPACTLDFTVDITQGVGLIRPGTQLSGTAHYTASGQTIRQDGGSTGHLAQGTMTIGDGITGEIWTLITTSSASATDLVGIYANDVEGFSFAGQDFEGPMSITLFGAPGTRPDPSLPVTQAEWDRMDLRRTFSLHANGDMLAGDVTDLRARCP